jgi:hypothetical protein
MIRTVLRTVGADPTHVLSVEERVKRSGVLTASLWHLLTHQLWPLPSSTPLPVTLSPSTRSNISQ